jgi:hypothetical protein
VNQKKNEDPLFQRISDEDSKGNKNRTIVKLEKESRQRKKKNRKKVEEGVCCLVYRLVQSEPFNVNMPMYQRRRDEKGNKNPENVSNVQARLLRI